MPSLAASLDRIAMGQLGRLQRALLPDYNLKASAYWWTMVLLGAATIAYSLLHVSQLPTDTHWQLIACGVIATLAGAFPLRIPRSTNSFAAGEIFIFLLLLLHGPAAAALASAGEALVGSWRTSKRWSSRLASPAMAAVAMFMAGSLLHWALAELKARDLFNEGVLLTASMLFAITYFVFNTLLVTLVVNLKRNEWPRLRTFLGSFGWVGFTYAGSALVAALLELTFQSFGIGVLVAAVPIIAMLLTTLHYYFRQQESDDRVLEARMQAAEREAVRTTQHLRELEHIAYHDSLTSLANRNRFNECLLQALENQRADPSRHFAVMYLDFDRFKLINDSLGHGAGDELLLKVARRIQQHVRPTDVLARLGGDEFAILTEHINNREQTVALAERLQEVLREPLQIAGKEITTSASIGITFSDFGYRTPEEVLRDADLAMYKAKAKGKAQFALFDSSLHKQATEQLSLEGDLRRALVSGQLSLVFQPIYELAPRRLIAFEALLRWHHPQRGLVGPATFIPLAEESGLIEPLSRWVLQRACKQLSAWHAQYPRMARIGMHMNASSKDFASVTFSNRVSDTLARLALAPSLLTLEITENALMERMDTAATTMTQLRALGVGLSIDDFGTGYSSLSYLSRLPINSLKIDRSFVSQLQGSAENSEIVRAVITLGASLGKQVIAEGIESAAQLGHLEQLHCGHGQGFLLAEPLTVRQASALLAGISAQSGVPAPAAEQLASKLPLSLRRQAKLLLPTH